MPATSITDRLCLRSAALILAALLCSASGTSARAYDFEVSARTEGYGYQLRHLGQNGLSLVSRRRLTQYLGVRVFNLLDPGQAPHDPKHSDRPPALLYMHGMMRFSSDFGGFSDNTEGNPELVNDQFELLTGALEGRNLWGQVDFTLGRQFDSELMDYFAFDGLRVRVNSPWRVYLESYFGAQVNRTHPLGMNVFEIDGTSGKAPTDQAWAPSFGVAGGVDAPEIAEVRVAYRGVASKADVRGDDTGAVTDSLWGVDQELLFFHLAVPVADWGPRLAGGMRYNLLLGQFDDLTVSATQWLAEHELRLEYLRSRPHFDGDSIFNLFDVQPFSELAARYGMPVASRWRVEGRVGYRWFWPDQAEEDVDSGAVALTALAHWTGRRAGADLELFYADGYGGRRFGGDLGGRYLSPRWVFGRRIGLDGRVSVIHFDDGTGGVSPLTTLSLQFGTQIRLLPGVHVHLMVEDNINRLYDSTFRVIAALDMRFAP